MRGERPFVYHTPNGREMFQALQKIFARPTDGCGKPLRRGRRPAVERSGTNALGVRRPVSAAVPRWEAPSGRGLSAQPTGGEKTPPFASSSVSASRCHLPRRGRQGENGLPRRFAPRNDSASRCMVRRPTKKGSTLAGTSLIYTQCFSRLSQRLLSHVPRLWNSCTSRIRMTTATSITRYLYR